MNPFSTWPRMMSATLEMQRHWLQTVETLSAASSVVQARGDLMNDAVRSPFTADIGEFSRMIPEKMDAFGRSGQSVMRDVAGMQAAWWAQAQQVGAMAFVGRVPTLREVTALAERTQEYALGSMDAALRMNAAALAPVRRTAMRNARRLGAGKR
jgi:hypothetical protein